MFKIGDKVRVINPEFVVKVGYPVSFDDACLHVEKTFGHTTRNLLDQVKTNESKKYKTV